MRGRDLSGHRRGDIPEHGLIELSVPELLTIGAFVEGGPSTFAIELDLIVAPDDDVVGLIVPTRGLFDIGLRPILPLEMIGKGGRLRPLSIVVERPVKDIVLTPGLPLASLAFFTTAGRPIYHDRNLEYKASPDDLPFLGWPED